MREHLNKPDKYLINKRGERKRVSTKRPGLDSDIKKSKEVHGYEDFVWLYSCLDKRNAPEEIRKRPNMEEIFGSDNMAVIDKAGAWFVRQETGKDPDESTEILQVYTIDPETGDEIKLDKWNPSALNPNWQPSWTTDKNLNDAN